MDKVRILARYGFSKASAENYPARIVVEEDHALINLRLFKIEEHGVVDYSVCFLTDGDTVFKYVDGASVKPSKTEEPGICEQIEHVVSANQMVLQTLVDEVEDFEDRIFMRQMERNSIDTWFQLRATVARLKRSFSTSSSILAKIEKSNFFDRLRADNISSVIEKSESSERDCTANLQKLDSLHHYLASVKADKLNANLYLLALVSGVFLPLNLVVGFFGMNTGGMYLQDGSDGTRIVLQCLGVTFAFLILGLPMLRVLDHIIFRRIFRHNRLYSRLSDKLGDLNESFTIPFK